MLGCLKCNYENCIFICRCLYCIESKIIATVKDRKTGGKSVYLYIAKIDFHQREWLDNGRIRPTFWAIFSNTDSTLDGLLLLTTGENVAKLGTILLLSYHGLLWALVITKEVIVILDLIIYNSFFPACSPDVVTHIEVQNLFILWLTLP